MTYQIITLGCKVNHYESNAIDDMMQKSGFVKSDDPDIYIVNTCTVTNSADSKTMKVINRLLNEDKIIVVAGCLVQVNEKSLNDISGIDILVGNEGKSNIPYYVSNFIENRSKIIDVKPISSSFEDMNIDNSNKTRAYVKIQDGCNNYCSFCIIPFARGNVRSKDRLAVIREVSKLILNGHKEIVLTGIHTGNYGSDLNINLATLLNDLLKIEGLERIRISSIEATEITSEILSIIENNKILVDHMHIPLQSGSNEILKLMNRKYLKEEFIEIITKLKKIRPNMSITTDVIVGFPNETEELFNETVETIKKIGFSFIHVFPYSKRNNTEAAAMENQVSDLDKKRRVKELLILSKELNQDYMNKFIGSIENIIVESYKDGYVKGHTSNYLMVKVLGEKEDIRKTIKVKITAIEDSICLGVKI